MIIIICIAALIGLVKGFTDRVTEIRLSRRAGVPVPPVYVSPKQGSHLEELRKQVAAMETGPPPEVIDKINALDFSADVIRREIELLESQCSGVYDPIELVKINKKIAAAYKKLYSEYDKAGKLRTTYGIY